MDLSHIKAIVFDKDGTLIDFRGTWDAWAAGLIADLTDGTPAAMERLATAMGYDLAAQGFREDSPIIAGTHEQALDCVMAGLPEGVDRAAISARVEASVLVAPMAPVVPLAPLLSRLQGAGFKLGVATNDIEAAAHAHMEALGVQSYFDAIIGSDSGYGGKPAPGMVLGFAETVGLAPEVCLMVGDSTHDLLSAQAAGAPALGVLTGTAGTAELAPFAVDVVPDIGHLPRLLGLAESAA